MTPDAKEFCEKRVLGKKRNKKKKMKKKILAPMPLVREIKEGKERY